MAMKNVQWSSRSAFILAAVGSSVGLGNLWRFSSEVGTNGGGAFILVYLTAVLFVGIPVLLSEYLVGRAGQSSNPVNSVIDVADNSSVTKGWGLIGWFGMIGGFLIVTFYCMIAGWVLKYVFLMLGDSFSGLTPDQVAGRFVTFIGSPWQVLPWFLVFAAFTTWLVSRGVNDGIEWAAKLLMPVFFSLLIILATASVRSGMSSGGTLEALRFLYVPDWQEMLNKNPDVSALANFGSVGNAALGQAFFSIGVGSAIMITYGSYIPNEISIQKSAIIVALMDTFVALLAGLAIFPLVFSHGFSADAGPSLLFITLPNVFEVMGPIGPLIGAAFFFLAFFAAITSSTSLLEPSAAFVSERFNMSKKKAAYITGGLMTLVGLISVFGVGEGGATPALDAIDAFTGKVLLPLGGFLVVIFVGWRVKADIVKSQLDRSWRPLGSLIFYLTKYVAPIFVGVVMVSSMWGYITSF